jgi:alkylated DNA nucleotide flippase Atl1
MSDAVESAIFDLLAKVPPGKSVSPEDVARAVDPEGWRRMLGRVRGTAVGLARAGRLIITRHGKPADPDDFKGVWRMRLPE